MVKKMFLLLPLVLMAACFETDPKKCTALIAAQKAACATDSAGTACKAAGVAVVAAGCVVDPGPTPQPTPPVATPTPTPTATPQEPTPTPVPTPLPTPTVPPVVSYLPKPLAPGAEVYLNNKKHGQGVDSTVRVRGDLKFCQLIHGDGPNVGADCHLEGWPNRALAEMELADGCPVWQSRTAADPTPRRCSNGDNGLGEAGISCDHFGSVEFRDDPQTPEFEGKPVECSKQFDQYGPMAGFWVVAHGKGWVRACLPNGSGCGPWVEVDH